MLREVPVSKVKEFQTAYLAALEAQYRPTLDALRAGKIDDEITGVLEKVAKEVAANFK